MIRYLSTKDETMWFLTSLPGTGNGATGSGMQSHDVFMSIPSEFDDVNLA
jgi:hypothetical protein